MNIRDLQEIKTLLDVRRGYEMRNMLRNFTQTWYGQEAVSIETTGTMTLDYDDERYYQQGNQNITVKNEQGQELRPIYTEESIELIQEETENYGWGDGETEFKLGEALNMENESVEQAFIKACEDLPECK